MTFRSPLSTWLAGPATAALLALSGSGAMAAGASAAKPAVKAAPSTSAPSTSAASAPAVTTASGLVFQSVKEGTGPNPAATDVVRVHYRGTFMDGREFDSSYSRGEPAEFPLNRVIKCWTEGVQKIKVGGKAHLTCPAAIAYGPRGTPDGTIPPNATLQFDVELLAIKGR